jgi:hypothetical protein
MPIRTGLIWMEGAQAERESNDEEGEGGYGQGDLRPTKPFIRDGRHPLGYG